MIYKDALNNVSIEVQKGRALNASLAANPLFSPMLVQLVMIGEESGKMSEMIEKAAEYFQNQVDTLIVRLSALIEPAILLVVGCIVGVVIIAMYLPLFNLATLARA